MTSFSISALDFFDCLFCAVSHCARILTWSQAKMTGRGGNMNEVRNMSHITGQNEDDVVTALRECGGDLDSAMNKLLDSACLLSLCFYANRAIFYFT